jgi:hypothetical protein
MKTDQPYIENLEQALAVMGNKIASPNFAAFVRRHVEAGTNLKYELTIIKKSNQTGIIVALDCRPMEPKVSCGVFLRLA